MDEKQLQHIKEYPYRQRDHLDYPEITLYQAIAASASKYPDDTALEFYGRKISYSRFLRDIDRAADAFSCCGIGMGDAVTICLPNTPTALTALYAVNRLGAIANMVHPLSSQNEITYYLNLSESKIIVTIDLFYEKVAKAVMNSNHNVMVLVTRMQDDLPKRLIPFYTLNKGLKYLKYPGLHVTDPREVDSKMKVMLWKFFIVLKNQEKAPEPAKYDPDRCSLILYSGGTTGAPHGIMLSDKNINAECTQAVEALGTRFDRGMKVLGILPIFHGFGLAIGIHVPMMQGICCTLMPAFSKKAFSDAMRKKKPNYIAGVPTIFDALLHIPALEGVDLSYVEGFYSGGDTLSVDLKKRVDAFLKEHNSKIQVREGYGLTECVTASCVTPRDEYKEGSIGIPFPDMKYAIVKPGTMDVLPPDTEGEIVISGPTVMLGYLKNEKATEETIETIDGVRWLHTGDLGVIDKDGYVFFRQRIKRMIITNGYNVYPTSVERAINACADVDSCCVIGVKDPRRVQRVRAYIVLKGGVKKDDDTKERIMNEIKLSVSSYALPRELIFRDSLPKTPVGKIAYRTLEEEAEKEGIS